MKHINNGYNIQMGFTFGTSWPNMDGNGILIFSANKKFTKSVGLVTLWNYPEYFLLVTVAPNVHLQDSLFGLRFLEKCSTLNCKTVLR